MRSGIEQATEYFESRGREVVFGPNHRRVHGYLAGSDAERAADLQWALTEPGIDMVHALEGGYGTARDYPLIDWDAVGHADPRIVCGFSDLTALHLFIARHTDWISFYGPSFLRFTRTKGDYALTERTEEFFHKAVSASEPVGADLRGPRGSIRAHARRRCRGGARRRRLSHAALLEHRHAVRGGDRGANPARRGPQDGPISSTRPSTISASPASSTGSPASPSAPASTSATRRSPRAQSTLSIEEILDELIAPLGVPAISNVPFGHGKHMATIPLGARARLDGDGKYLELLEPGSTSRRASAQPLQRKHRQITKRERPDEVQR